MTCTVCGVLKTPDNTYLRPNGTFRSYCKTCWQVRSRAYQQIPGKTIVADIRRVERRRFGRPREEIIARDGYKCLHCGMSRTESKKKFGRDLTIDHIDGNGISKPSALKNNDPSNLQTLCISCHLKKDVPLREYPRQHLCSLCNKRFKLIKTHMSLIHGGLLIMAMPSPDLGEGKEK